MSSSKARMSSDQDVSPPQPAHTPWSFRVATVAGIPIRLHATFLLFLVWIFLTKGSWEWFFLVVAVFACVILHELGHALTAQHFHVETRDITLYPIGGIAMLQGRPTPRQELWIALAGPAVNLLIAAFLVPMIVWGARQSLNWQSLTSGSSLIQAVCLSNLALAGFNLIPAFPMDGGRVLRAALALRMNEVKATQIAAAIGQILAVAFGIAGIVTSNVLLLLVAIFVFLGAAQESSASATRAFLAGRKVADAMQTRFRTIDHGASMETAAEMLLAGSQHDFPVVSGEEVLGILTRSNIVQGLAQGGNTAYVAEFMTRENKTANSFLPLDRAIDLLAPNDGIPILVMDEGKLVGMITNEHLSEFLLLENVRSRGR